VEISQIFRIPPFKGNHCLSVDVCRSELVMARRFLPPDMLGGYGLLPKRLVFRPLTWKVIGVLFAVLLVVLPTYIIAERAGSKLVPELTSLFYAASDPNGSLAPAALPAFPPVLPQVGTISYPLADGDSCDSVLAYQMRFTDASEVFSDQKPETVQALSATLGHDCHAIHPGTVLTLSPQYPLIAFGGVVLHIGSLTSPQSVPTPLINLPHPERYAPDCTAGCQLSVKIAPRVQIYLTVFTQSDIYPGSWIWSQAALARKVVPKFADYPYVDAAASLNGMTLQACDLQVNGVPAQNQTSSACDDLTAKNIHMDGGAWLFGVTGSSALNHWHYAIHAPSNSRVLIWLSDDDSGLTFHAGDPAYRYDQAARSYVKL
jgi:hypothetical protein